MEISHQKVYEAELEPWDYNDTCSYLKLAPTAFLEPGNDSLEGFFGRVRVFARIRRPLGYVFRGSVFYNTDAYVVEGLEGADRGGTDGDQFALAGKELFKEVETDYEGLTVHGVFGDV